MIRRAFTLTELSIVLSITAILIPLIYAFAAGMQDRVEVGLWYLEIADGTRAVAEELRLDAQRPECSGEYRVNQEQVLIREAPEACGGSRGLARYVEALRPAPGGVELSFILPLRAERAWREVVFIPVELP